jgi:putative Mg2+ transporter-C (MgtC) family protein
MIEVTPVELDMIFKVFISLILGMLIGIERRGGSYGPGFRTFALVCIGSTLFTVFSIHGFGADGQADNGRLAANIVVGIGFLGAGIIFRPGDRIVGATTAASVWLCAAIGIGVGLGYYLVSGLATLISMVILSKGRPIQLAKEHIQCTLPESNGPSL